MSDAKVIRSVETGMIYVEDVVKGTFKEKAAQLRELRSKYKSCTICRLGNSLYKSKKEGF